MPTLNIIVACSDNHAIGRKGTIPWECRGDMQLFSNLTKKGKAPVLIMGRVTAESIGRPLKGRSIIVVSKQLVSPIKGARVVGSLTEAIEAAGNNTIYICGGSRIYEEALRYPDITLHLSRIHVIVPDADVFFPSDWGKRTWQLVDTDTFIETSGPHWTYCQYRSNVT